MHDERPTRQSIDTARREQLEARDAIFATTGLRILDSGTPAFTERCTKCDYVAESDNQFRAANMLARHIVRVHWVHAQKGA